MLPLPRAPRIVPTGAGGQVTPAGREPRQAEAAGPRRVPRRGGGVVVGRAGGGAQVGEPPALSRLIADPPGRGCGTCQNGGFNYLRGAAGNQHTGRGWWVRGAGASRRGDSEGLI